MNLEELTTKVSEYEGKMQTLTKSLETLQAENAVLKLTVDERQAHNALSDEDKSEFGKCAAERRTELLAKGAETLRRQTELPEPIKRRFEDIEKRASTAEQELAEARRMLSEANASRQEAELRARAESEFAHLPGTVEDRVGILKSIAAMPDAAARAKAEEALKATSDGLGRLLKPIGKDGAGAPKDGWDRIEKRAQAVAKEKGITVEQATDEVLRQNPELYTEV